MLIRSPWTALESEIMEEEGRSFHFDEALEEYNEYDLALSIWPKTYGYMHSPWRVRQRIWKILFLKLIAEKHEGRDQMEIYKAGLARRI